MVGNLSQTLLQFFLGLFLIVISATFLLRPRLSFPVNEKSFILGGGISGFIVGLIGDWWRLKGRISNGFENGERKIIATAAVIALGTDATRIPSYISVGFLSEQYYYLIPILFATAVAGSYIGKTVVTRIDQDKFKKMVLIAIILASIKFMADGIKSF